MNYFYDTCVLFVTHVIMLLHNIMYKMLRFYVCAKGLIFDPQKGTPKKASFVGPWVPWCLLVTCVMSYTRCVLQSKIVSCVCESIHRSLNYDATSC